MRQNGQMYSLKHLDDSLSERNWVDLAFHTYTFSFSYKNNSIFI